MQTGVVKFFDKKKGFGFIVKDSDKKDIFYHVNDSIDKVFDNDDVVEFEINPNGKKGACAINVQKI